jgi:hypothetical protein
MSSYRTTLTVVLVLLAATAAWAHHAAAPLYHQDREVEVRGVVKTWRFTNPHPILIFEATEASGQKVEWNMQFAAATSLSKRGWSADTFKAGEVVIAKGHPSKAPGTHGLEAGTVTRADGRPVP